MTQASQNHRHPARFGQRIFIGFLALIALLYAGIVTYHLSVPRATAQDLPGFMEKCRELCLSYGLIPTGNIAMDAKAYLAVTKPQDLSAPLTEILADSEFVRAETEAHPLIGQTPPAFTLSNEQSRSVSLRELTDKGPVVIVFYYGYNCSHCVAQLFGLQKDLAYFKELGVQVVALSADSPEKTTESFAKYGRFDFPVLSDPDNKIAALYDVYTPPNGSEEEDLKHGTFLIDRSGKVIFANRGYQPFTDNKSLLYWLAGKPGWKKETSLPPVTQTRE